MCAIIYKLRVEYYPITLMVWLFVQIPEANFEHHGVYSCNVEYKIGSLTEPQLIQQQSSISIIDQGKFT